MRILALMLMIALIALGLLLYFKPKDLFPPDAPPPGAHPAATRATQAEPAPVWTRVVCASRGSDRNDGSPSRPFATIQQAADVAQPGDRILVRAGLYAESVVIQNSGTADRPIVFAGERGEDGEWLTIIDRSTPVDGWAPATEVGRGVYKTEALDFDPPTMLLDGRQVVRIPDATMQGRGGFEYLRVPPNEKVSQTAERPGVSRMLKPRRNNDHGFWDGVDVMYGNRDGAIYIRFRNGEHPTGRELRAAYAAGEVKGQPEVPPDGPNRRMGAPSPAFLLYNRQHIEIRDFRIRSAEIGVVIRGSEATDNVIADNYLSNGRMRVLVHQGASRNVVSGNRMTLGLYGHPRPGAWGSHPLNHHTYRVFKNIVGGGTSDDVGVHLQQTGARNVVRDNDIYAGLIGIRVIRSPEAQIYRNVIRNMSSVGIVSGHDGRVGNVDAHYFDNFVYDCNLNLRIHAYHGTLPGQRREYYYRNIFHSPPESGSDVFFHWGFANEVPEGMGHPEFYFYHNVFSSNQVFRTGRGDGLANTVLLNNVFDSAPPTRFPARFSRSPKALQAFAHNFASQSVEFVSGEAAWYGAHNTVGGNARIWDPAAPFPNFRLPEDHPARHAGLDLSRPFTAAGRTYPTLPGMTPGYFKGPAPHLGALQEGDSAAALLERAASLIPGNDD